MRKKFVYTLLSPAFLLLSALLLWGTLVEPFRITVNPVVIHDPELFREWGALKIVQISDLHITRQGRREELVLKKLSEINPDIIVVTGDMAQWNSRPEEAVRFIEKLSAPLGVYCVMGDADFSSRRYHCIFCHPGNNVHAVRRKPRLLRNEVVTVSLKNGNRMLIAGVAPSGDWGGAWAFPQSILGKSGPAILVLAHFSGEWAGIEPKRPVLWLSGDTHGGQILLPGFMWHILKLKPDPDHMAGLYRGGKHKWLYVNSGIGMTANIPLRVGVPPEITVFTFEGG